jgi:hypothetical protein
VNEAVDRGKAACLDAVPGTPSDRLKAMMSALWAMSDADILFRTPLDVFYASLTDEQKARLRPPPEKETVGGPVGGETNGPVCNSAANEMPTAEIVRSVPPAPGHRQPTAEQREGLDMLRGLSADLSNYLAQACPQGTPPTPVERLDAAGNRVQAMLYAAVSLDAAVKASSSQWSDDQKKTFDTPRRQPRSE